jgi:glycerol kinase
MQMQADCLQIPVKSSNVSELSALGVAYLAGIELKFFSFEDLTNLPLKYKEFEPSVVSTKLQEELNLWNNSLEKLISHE